MIVGMIRRANREAEVGPSVIGHRNRRRASLRLPGWCTPLRTALAGASLGRMIETETLDDDPRRFPPPWTRGITWDFEGRFEST
jgi:hypothetical protein